MCLRGEVPPRRLYGTSTEIEQLVTSRNREVASVLEQHGADNGLNAM